mgnify:CR=1 FL=1
MLTDYKFWYIARDDNDFITEAGIRFYEGEVTTLNEPVGEARTMTPITRYRRSKRLTESDMAHLGSGFKKESSGSDAKVYTSKDFGAIKTDAELRIFLNTKLKKDSSRTPIANQR